MNDIEEKYPDIIKFRRYTMGNIITILQEIFMGKEDNSTRIGLSEFKTNEKTIVEKKVTKKRPAAQELKLSELMRKTSYQ